MTHEKQQFLYNSKRNLKNYSGKWNNTETKSSRCAQASWIFLGPVAFTNCYFIQVNMVCDYCLLHLSSLWKNSDFQHWGTKGSPLWSNVKRQKHDFELGQSLELIVVRPGLGSDLKSRKELKLWVNQSGFSKPFFLEGKIFPSFDLVKF
jgi:hypothetical protein